MQNILLESSYWNILRFISVNEVILFNLLKITNIKHCVYHFIRLNPFKWSQPLCRGFFYPSSKSFFSSASVMSVSNMWKQAQHWTYLSLCEVKVDSDFVTSKPCQIVVVSEFWFQFSNLFLGERCTLLPRFTAHVWLIAPILGIWNEKQITFQPL